MQSRFPTGADFTFRPSVESVRLSLPEMREGAGKDMSDAPQFIYKQYPPNHLEICKAIPAARRPGVVFSYGDKIYVPSGEELSHALKVHEAVHCIRQKELGVEFWWGKYLTDMRFRYNEELVAHRAEYRALVSAGANRNLKRMALKLVAQRLASPLYGCGGGWKKAADDILKGL